jgi:hypothetical protein
LGSFLGVLFRLVKNILWSSAKDMGGETLRTGGKILSDIADNKSSDISAHNIVSEYICETAQSQTGKLSGRVRKRKCATSAASKIGKKKNKN